MVSIIIPNYNNSKYLKSCIESIVENCSIKTEIIIVDNKSTDDSPEVLEKLKKKYSNIKIYKMEKNTGFSHAVNFGIKKSKYDYVFLLNNDTRIHKNAVENLLDMIRKDQRIFSVNSLMIRMDDEKKIDDAGDYLTIFSVAYKGYDGFDINSYKAKTKRRIFSSCAGASIYRKEIFSKIGYFDENFFAYLEDVDISYRANIYGYKNLFCPTSKVSHRGSLTTGSKYNSFKVKLVGRNTIYMIYKNMPFLIFLINLPFILSGHIVKYIFYSKKGYGRDFLCGIKNGFKNLKNIKKTKFEAKNIFNYIKIEYFMIRDTLRYFVMRINRG